MPRASFHGIQSLILLIKALMILCGYAAVRLLCPIIEMTKSIISSTAREETTFMLSKKAVSGAETFIQLILLVENAVTISLIATYHPVTLLHGTTIELPFPSIVQSMVHCTILFTIEHGFRYWVHQILFPEASKQSCVTRSHIEDSAAFTIAGECMVSKGTLIFAMAIIGGLHPLGVHTHQLHLINIVTWAVLRRYFCPLGSGK